MQIFWGDKLMSIHLRKFNETDIPYKVKWINDPENNRYLHYDLPLREDKTFEWYKKNKDRSDRADYTIIYNNERAGLIGLLNIDDRNRKAEYYICLGGKKYKGKGIAYKATIELIKLAHTKFNLQKIYLFTEKDNIAAQKLFEKVGFEKEGLLKNDLIYNGRKIDRYIYGLDVNAFINRNLKVEHTNEN